jgi:dihydrofolate reductase
MRKVKLFIASSLDGYIAREDGSIDWLYTDGDYGYMQFYNSVNTVLMGRKTYDQTLGFGIEYPYKDKKNYVFSQNPNIKRKKDADIEFVVDVIEFVKQLTQSHGKDIWLVGGSDIISILLNAGLLHEIILSVHPIVLGGGIPLFKNLHRQVNLKLIKYIPYENSLVQLHYEL